MGKRSNKNNGKTVDTIEAIEALVTTATPLVEKVIDNAQNKSHEKLNGTVIIPELYREGFPLSLEQAEKLLEDCGLKTMRVELKLTDADPKYKNCFDTQVLDSSPKQGTNVKVGSTVCLQYITEAVIAESKKMFEEAEQSNAIIMEQKLAEKTERKKHTKEMASLAADKAKNGIGKMLDAGGKFIGGFGKKQ